jgi:dipeptidyl aminopeptidase/acylaminoacyl peptidase
MPDVVYEKGIPGPSSVRCLVPAVQKVVDMGIADPERVGLQGHSWGGYESAYIITQTNIFRAVCSGAPVSNMTSAYGGIRWGSGNPRTFQYETGQSRIGGNLWDYPELYIQNSPLFFADRVQTPLLIMHGDKVPGHRVFSRSQAAE